MNQLHPANSESSRFFFSILFLCENWSCSSKYLSLIVSPYMMLSTVKLQVSLQWPISSLKVKASLEKLPVSQIT